jgi:hypothetical protein
MSPAAAETLLYITEGALLALDVASHLQAASMRIQQAQAEGRPLSDEELELLRGQARARLDEVRARVLARMRGTEVADSGAGVAG